MTLLFFSKRKPGLETLTFTEVARLDEARDRAPGRRGWTVLLLRPRDGQRDLQKSTRGLRPELVDLVNRALRREFDAIMVWRLDRLGRSLIELWGNVERLVDRGVAVVSVKDGALDTSSAAGKLQLGVLAAVAEYEREIIRERTREGVARARAAGKQIGRPSRNGPALSAAMAWHEYSSPAPPIRECARRYKVPETSLRRALAARAKRGVPKMVQAALARKRCILGGTKRTLLAHRRRS